MDDFVNVSVRIRPPLREEEVANSCLLLANENPPVLLVTEKPQMYYFDNIFTDEAAQIDVYNKTVKKLVEKVKLGYNCTVFAYGQTGTGKSYTMGTNPNVKSDDDRGLISRTLEDLFVFGDDEIDFEMTVSFVEIYNEKVFDLLGPENKKIPLPLKGFTVQGVKKISVRSATEAEHYLQLGGSKRHIGETKQNLSSSRSHAIFSVHCCIRNSETETVAKLNLVDLAGCESVRKTGNQGSSFQEGVNINKGLLSLGQVMTALSTNSNHIPYRQSVITTLLHDSLNKKNFVSLIACVNATSDDLWETIQTLEFSNRVKKLKNKPEVNEFMLQYKKENSALFAKGLTPVKRGNGFLYETPFKRPRNALPIIREPVLCESNSNFDISPLCSSSMTSSVSENQQNFSPVIRKYINAMESSILAKFQDVIESTLKKPKGRKRNKENLTPPRLSWNEVSDDPNSSFIASSPDEELTTRNADISNTQCAKPKNLDLEDFPFKVPEKPKTDRITRASPRRRSVRLQLKANTSIIEVENIGTRRRSIRLKSKAQATPRPKRKSPKKNRLTITLCMDHSTDSPMTARSKQVLTVLNDGTLREIEKLHTVGAKTAEKIVIFRQLKGRLSALKDLEDMPSFSKKKYERFVSENFLRG